MSRPTDFTPQNRQKILDALRAGATRAAASSAGGVCYRTLAYWLQKGEEARSGPFRAFCEAVELAEAQAEARFAYVLHQAAMPHEVTETRVYTKPDGSTVTVTVTRSGVFDWRAAAWWLERRNPQEFGPRSYLYAERKIDAEIQEALERISALRAEIGQE